MVLSQNTQLYNQQDIEFCYLIFSSIEVLQYIVQEYTIAADKLCECVPSYDYKNKGAGSDNELMVGAIAKCFMR